MREKGLQYSGKTEWKDIWLIWEDNTDSPYIWNVLWYMDNNCNYNKVSDWQYERDLQKHHSEIIWLYNNYIWRYNKPLENQTDECIDYIYNLLNKWTD